MPLNIASVFAFIPTNIWRPLKKFVTKDTTVVFDIAFKLSTKYTPGLLMVMMCLSFANQFVRNVEMDCSVTTGGGGSSRGGYSSGSTDTDLTDFCWNYETFLVVKALDPNMRGKVTYPGVSGYDKHVDEVLVQRYYKHVWLVIGILMFIAFLPYFCWKFFAVKKIKPLIDVTGTEHVTAEEQRLAYYLETTGFNENFGAYYIVCKIAGALSPLVQWYYLCGFLGKRYQYYGVEVLRNFMDSSAPWPNPMDALFPKMAKCEWARYGFGGDMETKSAQCQLPMNNLTQWSFFIYWWWITIIFFVNILSIFKLSFFLLPPVRKYCYRKFVNAACREDVEKCRSNGQLIPKHMRHKKSDVINVNLSFGDWLVLNFIKKNLPDWQFRDFIRKMVTTENFVLQLKEIPIPLAILPSCPPMEEEIKTGVEYGWHFDGVDGSGGGGHKASNMDLAFNQSKSKSGNCPPPLKVEMGFVKPKPVPSPPSAGGNSLPSYSACVTTTDSDTAESQAETPSTSAGTPLSPMLPEFSLNISKPVKIDRTNVNSKNPNKKETKKDIMKKPMVPPVAKVKLNHNFFAKKPIKHPPKHNLSDEENDW